MNDDSFSEDINFNIIVNKYNNHNHNHVEIKNDEKSKEIKDNKVIKTNKFTFKEDKKNDNTIKKVPNYEYFFLTKKLSDILEEKDSMEYICKKYIGYDKSTFKRVLLVTHGGLIMELLNVIRYRKGISLKHNCDTKYTGLYCVRIYCGVCGGECNDKKDCYLEYDFVIFNNSSHLGKKIEVS